LDRTMTYSASEAKASGERTATLRFDVVAGLSAAAVVLPKAMAYATVAGLPVAVGLYTAFVPMAIYALLGSSRVLNVSSTTTLAILTGTQLGFAVPDGDPAALVTATATLTALVGAMLLAARVLRLGFVANFISAPVLTGFKAGIGLVIVLDQVPKLLGIHITKQGFFTDLLRVVQHIPETSLMTLAVAAATILVLIGIERLWPRAPAPLVAAGGGIAATWFLGLQALGVSAVGMIPQGFPSLTMPDPALVEQLIPGALGIALMSFTETIAAGRTFARPGDPAIDANRELIATGAANLGGALFGAMPAGGERRRPPLCARLAAARRKHRWRPQLRR
jgi:MFS superfamily sulfate permease-like transporter